MERPILTVSGLILNALTISSTKFSPSSKLSAPTESCVSSRKKISLLASGLQTVVKGADNSISYEALFILYFVLTNIHTVETLMVLFIYLYQQL